MPADAPSLSRGRPARASRSGCTTALHWKLLVRPRLFLPEAFVDGTLTIEEGSLYDLIDLMTTNIELLPEGLLGHHLNDAFSPLRRLHQYNPLPRARRNVAHHYDLSEELYASFLDQDRQYSCAYFRDGTDDPRHRPARQEAAHRCKAADPTGAKGARHRFGVGRPCALLWPRSAAPKRDRSDALDGAAQSSRAPRRNGGVGRSRRVPPARLPRGSGHYDRIVSVGMFEHVGVNHYNAFFNQLEVAAGAGR